MYTTDAIVLMRQDAGEADLFSVLYTREFGKIRVRAQGVRKENAKLKGHLEPLSLSRVSFVLGRQGERLTHAALLEHWPRIRQDLGKLAAAWYFAALVDEHCLAGERDIPLWKLLVESLGTLEGGTFDRGALNEILRTFERNLLSCLGYGGTEDIRILGKTPPRPFLIETGNLL